MKRNSALWLILAIAVVPLVTAVVTYRLGLSPTDGQVNRGTLVSPVRTLSQWGGDAQRYTGHWTVLLKGQRACESCVLSLSRVRAVHTALGRDAARVRIAVDSQLSSLEDGVWVVDPQGNLVLHYDGRQPGEDLLHDLRRLLKVSRVG